MVIMAGRFFFCSPSETLCEKFKPGETKTRFAGADVPDERKFQSSTVEVFSKVSRPSSSSGQSVEVDSVFFRGGFFFFFLRSDGWKRFTFLRLLRSGSGRRVADCRLPFLRRHYKSQMSEWSSVCVSECECVCV